MLFIGPYQGYLLVPIKVIYWSLSRLFIGPYQGYLLVPIKVIYWSLLRLFIKVRNSGCAPMYEKCRHHSNGDGKSLDYVTA